MWVTQQHGDPEHAGKRKPAEVEDVATPSGNLGLHHRVSCPESGLLWLVGGSTTLRLVSDSCASIFVRTEL